MMLTYPAARTPGRVFKFGEHAFDERGARSERAVVLAAEIHVREGDPGGIEATLLCENVNEILAEQRGDQEKRCAAEDLRPDEPRVEAATMAAAERAGAALLQESLRISA